MTNTQILATASQENNPMPLKANFWFCFVGFSVLFLAFYHALIFIVNSFVENEADLMTTPMWVNVALVVAGLFVGYITSGDNKRKILSLRAAGEKKKEDILEAKKAVTWIIQMHLEGTPFGLLGLNVYLADDTVDPLQNFAQEPLETVPVQGCFIVSSLCLERGIVVLKPVVEMNPVKTLKTELLVPTSEECITAVLIYRASESYKKDAKKKARGMHWIKEQIRLAKASTEGE